MMNSMLSLPILAIIRSAEQPGMMNSMLSLPILAIIRSAEQPGVVNSMLCTCLWDIQLTN